MEVALARDDFGHARRYTFHIVGPLPRNFDGRFDRLSTRVHRQDLVVAEVRSHELFVFAEVAIVESPGGQGELFRLGVHGADDARMAVALVDRRVGTQKVVVLFPFDVPDKNAIASVQNHR